MVPATLLRLALVLVTVAAPMRRAVRAWQTYDATAAAAKFGLTYGPRLPLDWLFVAIVTGALSAFAGASFEKRRSPARWLFGAAAGFGMLATFAGAREPFALSAMTPAFAIVAAAAMFVIADRRADGAAHPSWLRDAKLRLRALFAGVLVSVSAIGIGLAEDERILPRSRDLHEACWFFGIAGGLFALFCLGAILIARSGGGGLGRKLLPIGFFAALAFGAFATYSLGFHWKETVSLCRDGSYLPTLAERRRATEEGTRRARSVFSVLPDLVFHFTSECTNAAAELSKIERGECPYTPLRAVPCTCGKEKLPHDARCAQPQCVPSEHPKTRCPGDPW